MSLELEDLTGKIIGIKKAKAKSRRAKRDKEIGLHRIDLVAEG